MRRTLALACLLVAACGPESDAGPGGVTPAEAEALNDAAEMLDNRSLLPPEPRNEADDAGG